MNEKQQQLTFDKGITNVPSDAICSDNALEECLGLTYENGEHKVIQKPEVKYTNLAGTLMYVHTFGGTERILVKDTVGGVTGLFYYDGTQYNRLLSVEPVKVESVGNTLIVKTASDGIHYILWKDTAYKYLGSRIPDISVTFSLEEFSDSDFGSPTKYVDLTDMLDGKILYYWYDGQNNVVDMLKGSSFKNDKYEDAKNALIGLVTMRLNEVKSNNCFAFPFWARYAIRLYDGTYTNISNPVLLLPSVRNNWHIFTCDDYGNEKSMNGGTNGGWAQTNYKPIHSKLKYVIGGLTGANNWSDIIAGVDIFLSEEVKSFDMEGKWTVHNAVVSSNGTSANFDSLYDGNHYMADICRPEYSYNYDSIPDHKKRILPWINPSAPVANWNETTRNAWSKCYYQPKLLSDNEIVDKLINSSNFYKVAEHQISVGDQTKRSGDFSSGVLTNLTTQSRLEYDDYFSRAGIDGEVIKVYNNRLHIGNVKRGFFAGFDHFSFTSYVGANEAAAGSASYTYYVYIYTDQGRRMVKAGPVTRQEIADVWFYYPDPRARQAEIYRGNSRVATLTLREHPRLNGAYAFRRLPAMSITVPSGSSDTHTSNDNNTKEELEEHIFVSEVNNPWVFTAKGDITTKTGKVIGLATQTMSLGELEHGIHPLSVFGTKGISMLRLAEDGTYMRSDEISREVALENNPCITETDGVVFFASKRGLMMLAGNAVKCASEQLAGKSSAPFKDYLASAFIAYDYRDALLWIFNNANSNTTCWVYNIKSGTYAHYDFGTGNVVTTAVNNYPDYLLQIGSTVYSLLERPDINNDGTTSGSTFTPNTYTCKLVSRPMKFENSLALKSLMQVRNIYQLSPSLTNLQGATIKLKVYVSNNLNNWMEIHSLTGMPWKYFKFEYNFTLMRAVDHFDGAVIVTQERRTNKLR